MIVAKQKRDRSREGIGKSERSYIKHDLIRKVAGGQIAAYRIKNNGRIAIVDGNAGDGIGVDLPQADFFCQNMSTTTADIATRLAASACDATVILCEKDKRKRAALTYRFSKAVVISDNANAIDAIPSDCGYVLWISDPCGPAGHGVEAMASLAKSIRSDFIIASNEGAVKRIAATKDEKWGTARERYQPMIDSETYWTETLCRRRLSMTDVIPGARNFRYRIIVAANHLSDAATRLPFKEVQ